ncbi:hypothetical protein [Streptomyces sp. SP18CS02]|uniref:hypothetical protein n=1 Tax=Streptomyces sp. SP18CS02 TaxID=3002531 RepID=UPI002E769CEF|nr:hypothetical protein [Streptomyces sp. SP18CS02]MEE1754808.1 hypothetical protein [Streptomyces sp. SP18CS02]
MTTTDGWTTAVRSRLGLGRLLPLGGAEDGAWLAERVAIAVLREAAWRVPGVSPGRLRIGLANPESAAQPALPPPPGALPAGPLRVEAEFAAGPPGGSPDASAAAGPPLPALAERLRTALFAAAGTGLGLAVTEVDLRVTALLDASDTPDAGAAPGGTGARTTDTRTTDTGPAGHAAPDVSVPAGPPGAGPAAADPVGVAAASVPGVARLTTVLGPSVHRAADHLRVEVAIGPGHRALDTARAVRAAVRTTGEELPVTVLVTDVGAGPTSGAGRDLTDAT